MQGVGSPSPSLLLLPHLDVHQPTTSTTAPTPTRHMCTRLFHWVVGKRRNREKRKRKERRREAEKLWPTVGQVLPLDLMQWYCRRPSSSLSLLVHSVIIIACQYYYSATNLVVAQVAQVENPCLICPYGATAGDDYAPYASEDPITCKELIDNAKLFETGSLWCAQYEEAGLNYCCPTTPENPCILCPNGITVADDYDPYNDGYTCSDWLDPYANFDAGTDTCTVGWGALDIKSHCCPTVANNPCKICPDGATSGEEIFPYFNDKRTCKEFIEADLTFDAESEMCVHAYEHEHICCSSSTIEFDDYCNICPDGITASVDFSPWSSGETCKQLVEDAKMYENGSVGCNYYKGHELSCCPGADTDAENTPIIPTISPPIGINLPTVQTVRPVFAMLFVCGLDYSEASTNHCSLTSCPTGDDCEVGRTCYAIPFAPCSPATGTPETDTTTTSPTSSITTNNPTIVAPKTTYAPTPSPTPTNPLYIVEVTTGIVGAVAALVGAAFAFARWKQKVNSPTSTPAMPTAAP